MEDKNGVMRKFHKELNAGTAALVLLRVLDRADNPMYGYQIARLIENETRNVSIMKQGALYPVLRSLESGGLLCRQVGWVIDYEDAFVRIC